MRLGTIIKADLRKRRPGNCKLTVARVQLIKRRLAIGIPQQVIARDEGLPKATVNAIATGRNWGWVAP